jgi:hypothetical protein
MIGFIGASLQFQPIVTAHNQLLSNKTRSIPYWTTNVFSSTVTDLVLIYESLTSELRKTNAEWRLTYEWTLKSVTCITSGRTE